LKLLNGKKLTIILNSLAAKIEKAAKLIKDINIISIDDSAVKRQANFEINNSNFFTVAAAVGRIEVAVKKITRKCKMARN